MNSPSLSSSGMPYAVPKDSVATLYAGRFGRFQIVHCSGREDASRVAGSTRGYHVLVPLGGAFLWHRGANEPVFANSKTILHVVSNNNYYVSHPAGEELSAVFWPARSFVHELTRGGSVDDDCLPTQSFCTASIQLALRKLIATVPALYGEMAFEETMVDVLGKIYSQVDCNRSISAKSMRAVQRAKEYMHAYLEEKLSLSEIAEAAGVSPVYLTQLFSATEGVPLYRYHLDLRLNAALNRLPECEDITAIALDLGFSSHSHFSSEFLRRFGIPPSEYRSSMRSPINNANPHLGRPGLEHPAIMEIGPLCEARGGRPRLLAA